MRHRVTGRASINLNDDAKVLIFIPRAIIHYRTTRTSEAKGPDGIAR